MVFPGQIPDIVKRNAMKLVIPEDCRKIGICDDVPNYPDELVSQLISQVSFETEEFNFISIKI